MEKKIIQANGTRKQADLAALNQHRWPQTQANPKRKGHFILLHQEDIVILHTSPPKLAAPNFIQQTLRGIKSQINPDTVTVVTSICIFPNGQNIIRETLEINGIIGQITLIDIHITFFPHITEDAVLGSTLKKFL